MAKKKKGRRKPQERVVTEFRQLSTQQWNAIWAIPWTKASQLLVAHLSIGTDNAKGEAKADPACQGA